MSGSVSSPIPAGWRVPLFYPRFDGSRANTALVNQRTLLIGTASTGTTLAATPQPVLSALQAAGTYGQNSVLARAIADYLANDPTATVYALALPIPGPAVAATCTITLAGTATAAGTLSLYIAGDAILVAVTLGMTAAQLATATAAAVQANVPCATSAAAASAVVTLTAETAGALGNQIDVRLNYYGLPNNEVTPPGLTVAITAMTGGATDPDLTGLDAILGDLPFDFIVSPYTLAQQTTPVSAMMNNVAGRWSTIRQVYGHVFGARSDIYANLLALGQSLNDPHLTVLATSGSPTPPWRAAAMYAGASAGSLKNLPSQPLQTLPLVGFLAPAEGAWLGKANQNALLSAGMATASYAGDGSAAILRAVTTFQTNQFGLPDNAYLDTETPFILMRITRDQAVLWTSKYGRALLVPDDTHITAPGVVVLSPAIAKAEIAHLYDTEEEQGLVDDADAMLAATTVAISSTDPSRLQVDFVPNLVSGLRILDMLVQFTLLAAASGQ